MKRIFLAIFMSAITVYSNAQSSVKYEGEVVHGYSFGVGNLPTDRINVHTVHGVKIGKSFFAGLGTGVDYYYEGDGGDLIVPFFLNMKGYIQVEEPSTFTPFISLDLGYRLIATGEPADMAVFCALRQSVCDIEYLISTLVIQLNISQSTTNLDWDWGIMDII